jgi:hypothetical protein
MRVICFSVALVALIVACDRTPTRPSSVPGPAPVSVIRLEIVGPGSVPPGATAQFTAIAHRSDGTTEDITRAANWRSFRPNVLSITPTGLATGQILGDANIQVTSQLSAMREIVVVPADTYRLVGLVTEADSPTTPVQGAQVEVFGGGSAAPPVLTGFDGRYRLYGVPARAEIRVTKPGYQPLGQAVSLSDHQTQNFALDLVSPRVDLAGTYTLTLAAAAECRDTLPQEVWTRRYTATVTQTGSLLDVALSGATFVVDASSKGDGFRGRIEPGRVVFTMDYGDFYYYRTWPDVIEEIDPSLYFGVYGSVAAAVTPANVSGALNGAFFTVAGDPRRTFPAPNRFCRSTVHQLVLQR